MITQLTRMKTRKDLEINLFTFGDSSDINSWSGLPYFFSTSLLKQGVKLNRVDISPNKYLKSIYRRYGRTIRFLFGKHKKLRPVNRTRLCFWLTDNKIRRSTQCYRNADLNIFLTYIYSSHKFSAIPVVHFGDRVREQDFQESATQLGKEELWYIKREKEILRHSMFNLSTSRACVHFMRHNYHIDNAFLMLGGVNIDRDSLLKYEDKPFTAEEAVKLKLKNHDILFVGKHSYKRGADILIKAFRLFNEKHRGKFTLHLVGITEQKVDAAEIDETIKLHGYMDKWVAQDYRAYINLYKSARLFVMPMRQGPPPGAAWEAGFFYTPVIVANVDDTELTAQDGFNGIVVDSVAPEAYAEQMDRLVVDNTLWEKMSRNARTFVDNLSWDRTASQVVNIALTGQFEEERFSAESIGDTHDDHSPRHSH